MVRCHAIFGHEAEMFILKQCFNSLEFYCVVVVVTEKKDLLPALNGAETLGACLNGK